MVKKDAAGVRQNPLMANALLPFDKYGVVSDALYDAEGSDPGVIVVRSGCDEGKKSGKPV